MMLTHLPARFGLSSRLLQVYRVLVNTPFLQVPRLSFHYLIIIFVPEVTTQTGWACSNLQFVY